MCLMGRGCKKKSGSTDRYLIMICTYSGKRTAKPPYPRTRTGLNNCGALASTKVSTTPAITISGNK